MDFLKNQQKIAALFEVVRDIPYGDIGSRDPLNVLKEGKGSCSGKHLLLGKLYETMGIKVKYMMCLTQFNFLRQCFPKELQSILDNFEIPDYHNFLRIYTNKWVDVDITFDLFLTKYGFPVNLKWNGLTNCKIAFHPIEIFEVRDLIEEKQIAINNLPYEKQELRKDFIKKMANWLENIREINR